MPLFVCENCHGIDNTATGYYWCSDLYPEPYKGKKLCSECASPTFSDGTPNRERGKWHGRFPKVIATKEIIDARGRQNFIFTAGL